MYEYNKPKREDNATWEEQRQAVEIKTVAEDTNVKEFLDNDENNAKPAVQKVKPTKKKNTRSAGLRFFTAMAAATVFTVAVILPPQNSVKAEIAEIIAKRTEINYSVYVEEAPSQLRLVVTNGVKQYQQPLDEGENAGTVDGLVPNMEYTVSIVGNFGFGDKTIVSQTTRTTNLETVWYEVTHECLCNLDGYFHFTMDFVDDNSWLTEFTATLTDSENNISTCTFNDDLQSEQVIDVINTLIGNEATFRLTCWSTEPNNEQELVLFEGTVKI